MEIEVHRSKASKDRGRWKDKASGDQRSPCSTISFVAPPPFILLPTTRLGQIGLFFFLFFSFFFFFFFSYLLVLIQLYCKNCILFWVLCLDYVRCFLRVKQRDWNKDQTFSHPCSCVSFSFVFLCVWFFF